MPSEIAPSVSVIQSLEAPFSCFLSYAFCIEDCDYLFTVVTEVVFFNKSEKALPVLGKGHCSDLFWRESYTVIQEILSCCFGTFLGKSGVVEIDSVRGRADIDDDAVY